MWQEFKQEITQELLALAEHLSGMLNEAAPTGAGGNLHGGFSPISDIQANGISVDVGNPSPHGAYVEFGTKPHWTSVDNLTAWVDIKQLDRIENFIQKGTTSRKTRKIPKNASMSPRDKQILSIAYRIQHGIAMHGTRAQFFMRNALTSLGLKFTVEHTPMDSTYIVDTSDYLRQRMPGMFV